MLTLSGPEGLLPGTLPKQFIPGLLHSHCYRSSLLRWNPIISRVKMRRAGLCCAAHSQGCGSRGSDPLHPEQGTGLEVWPPILNTLPVISLLLHSHS